jgi:uncharacterized protein YrrD
MKYDSQLYDLPVVDRLSGDVVGYMRGVVCKPGKKRIDGVIFEEKGWLRRCHFIPWPAVSVIGEKSVVIDCSKKSRAAKSVACPGRESKVYNSEGSYVGRVSNYLIDEKSGSVLGMELSASIVDDLKFGRKIIENRGNIMKGEDFLMLADSFEEGCTELNERRSEDERLY